MLRVLSIVAPYVCVHTHATHLALLSPPSKHPATLPFAVIGLSPYAFKYCVCYSYEESVCQTAIKKTNNTKGIILRSVSVVRRCFTRRRHDICFKGTFAKLSVYLTALTTILFDDFPY